MKGTMTDEQALDLAAALREADKAGFGLWHLGAWSDRGWGCTLHNPAQGGFTEGRHGRDPATAVRSCLAHPGKTENEKRAVELGLTLSKMDLLRARVEIRVERSDGLFDALDEAIVVRGLE
jgi:hypothetical protein